MSPILYAFELLFLFLINISLFNNEQSINLHGQNPFTKMMLVPITSIPHALIKYIVRL